MAFFLVAMENHPLYKSHFLREVVQIEISHYPRIKFFEDMRQMESEEK